MNTLMLLADTTVPAEHVVLSDGISTLTRTQLEVAVQRLVSRLEELGITRLGLHADNGVEWVVTDLACQQAGIVCVPLPLFFSPEQIAHVISTCGLQAVCTQQAAQFSTLCCGESLPVLNSLSLMRCTAAALPALPEGSAKVTFTSGSTGTPKGVCLSTQQQIRQAQALHAAVGLDAPLHLCLLPLSTLLENIAGVYAPLLAGGRVEIRSLDTLGYAGSGMQAPEKFLQTLTDVKPDSIILIPQLLHLLVHAVRAGWQPPVMKFIAVGGAHVSEQLLLEARASGLPVFEGYGLSECSSVVSLNTPQHDQPGSCGMALPGSEIKLLDGEVLVQGSSMLGYVSEPESWNQQWVATGDLGELDAQGFLYVSGRSKNLLISSYGRNINPEWVESEIQASMLFGDVVLIGDARPWCAALLSPVTAQVSDIKIQKVLDQVNQQLPDYARVQRWIRLPEQLAVNGLLTANGRPRRAAIAAHYQQQIDDLYGIQGLEDCGKPSANNVEVTT